MLGASPGERAGERVLCSPFNKYFEAPCRLGERILLPLDTRQKIVKKNLHQRVVDTNANATDAL